MPLPPLESESVRLESRFTARLLFLEEIRRLVPEVLEELAGAPLAALQGGEDAREAIEAWADRWHLVDPEGWFIGTGLSTVRLWAALPESLAAREWRPKPMAGFVFRPPRAGTGGAPYNPTVEPRRGARARLRGHGSRALDRAEGEARRQGFVQTARVPSRGALAALVRFQLLGQNRHQVALEDLGEAEDARQRWGDYRDAIARAAAAIGLTLRDG